MDREPPCILKLAMTTVAAGATVPWQAAACSLIAFALASTPHAHAQLMQSAQSVQTALHDRYLQTVSYRQPAALAAQAGYGRSVQLYRVPELDLINQRGKSVALRSVLDSDTPVLMQFIFISCSTICPVQSAIFSSAQHTLDKFGQPYRMVSISIDPEQDTPRMLHAYAQRFEAGKQWDFLTGNRHDIMHVLRAFDLTMPAGNKMYHQSYTFLHGGTNPPWIKLNGMPSLADLTAEVRATYRLEPSMTETTVTVSAR